MIRIGLDIDDTLADFLGQYTEEFPGVKNMEHYTITKNVFSLRKSPEFWKNLPVLHRIDFIPALYCTKRINSKSWTKTWLDKNGFGKAPIYQVYSQIASKAPLIKGRCDVFIDDSVTNFKQINASGTLCLLLDGPHNRHIKTDLRIYDLKFKTIFNKYVENYLKV